MGTFEIVDYPKIKGFNMFFNSVEYRTAHFHHEWELLWVWDEPLIVTCGGKSFQVEPGQLILFGPNEPHEFHKVNNRCTHLCMLISPNVLPAMPRLQLKEYLLHGFLRREELTELKQDIIKLMGKYLLCEQNYELYCVGQGHMILWRILSKIPAIELTDAEAVDIDRRNARLKRLIAFVDENYMQKIRLADFAEQENCSLSYISRFVKETLNQTFQEYLTTVRFNCACNLMAEGGKKMLDVCMESGFSDYRYFSREFQKRCGMTPEKYNNSVKKKGTGDICTSS